MSARRCQSLLWMHSIIPMHSAGLERSVVRKSLSGRLNTRGKSGQSFSILRSASWLSVITVDRPAFPVQQVPERQLSLCIEPFIWLAQTRRPGYCSQRSPRRWRTLFGQSQAIDQQRAASGERIEVHAMTSIGDACMKSMSALQIASGKRFARLSRRPPTPHRGTGSHSIS